VLTLKGFIGNNSTLWRQYIDEQCSTFGNTKKADNRQYRVAQKATVLIELSNH